MFLMEWPAAEKSENRSQFSSFFHSEFGVNKNNLRDRRINNICSNNALLSTPSVSICNLSDHCNLLLFKD